MSLAILYRPVFGINYDIGWRPKVGSICKSKSLPIGGTFTTSHEAPRRLLPSAYLRINDKSRRPQPSKSLREKLRFKTRERLWIGLRVSWRRAYVTPRKWIVSRRRLGVNHVMDAPITCRFWAKAIQPMYETRKHRRISQQWFLPQGQYGSQTLIRLLPRTYWNTVPKP